MNIDIEQVNGGFVIRYYNNGHGEAFVETTPARAVKRIKALLEGSLSTEVVAE